MTVLMILSFVNIQYLIRTRPLESRTSNLMEIFDEFTILTFLELRFFLLDKSVNSNMRTVVGWSIIAMVSANILTHFGILIMDNFIKVILKFRKDQRKKKRRQLLEKQLEENENLAALDPEKYKNLKETVQFNKAIDYAKSWWPHRKWLLDQGVNITNYPEEIKF